MPDFTTSDYVAHANHDLELVKAPVEYRQIVLSALETMHNAQVPQDRVGVILRTIEVLYGLLPLEPLTGEDDEWRALDVEEDSVVTHINNRCARVFKLADGTALDMMRYYFLDPWGNVCVGPGCEAAVTFPYMPETSRKLSGE